VKGAFSMESSVFLRLELESSVSIRLYIPSVDLVLRPRSPEGKVSGSSSSWTWAFSQTGTPEISSRMRIPMLHTSPAQIGYDLPFTSYSSSGAMYSAFYRPFPFPDTSKSLSLTSIPVSGDHPTMTVSGVMLLWLTPKNIKTHKDSNIFLKKHLRIKKSSSFQ
jgi:hypothetical protein